jgi:hypothetical protein
MWRGMGKGMLLWGIEGKWKAVLLWLRIMTAFWVSAKSAHACTEMEKRRKGKALFTIPGRGGMTGPRPRRTRKYSVVSRKANGPGRSEYHHLS